MHADGFDWSIVGSQTYHFRSKETFQMILMCLTVLAPWSVQKFLTFLNILLIMDYWILYIIPNTNKYKSKLVEHSYHLKEWIYNIRRMVCEFT